MQLMTPDIFIRPATVKDAPLVHAIYQETPEYFKIISIPIPSLAEVERELEAAAADPRRFVELIVSDDPLCQLSGIPDEVSGQKAIGYLDYKLDYPETCDATVNLLLIMEPLQSHGYGTRSVRNLEKRLNGRIKRVLASVYGKNPRAERFWNSLGYRFAIDAKPILEWYAKALA